MFEMVFGSVLTEGLTGTGFIACTAASLVLGTVIALMSKIKNRSSGSFIVALAILPTIVQVVIMLVNGNIGAGVAVAGAFSLVRFRSAPGSAREIGSIFLAMAVGLAVGMGYIGIAVVLSLVVIVVMVIYAVFGIGMSAKNERELKITIPESLDYTNAFDEVFDKYTKSVELTRVKTTNMGSLFKLNYRVVLKDDKAEKQMIDELRCRNGNLEIMCSRPATENDSL